MVPRWMKGWQEGHVPAQTTTYPQKERNFRHFGFQATEGSTKGSLPHTKLMTQTWSHYCKHLFTFSIQYSQTNQTSQIPLLGCCSHCKPAFPAGAGSPKPLFLKAWPPP